MISVCYEKEHLCVTAYDDGKRIGECSYQIMAGDWVIDHTFVEDAYRNRGIAGQMVDCLVEEAHKTGKTVLATCSYAKERLEQRKKIPAEVRKKQEEADFRDLLGRIPGKVSDLQDEIDMMNRRKRK